MCAECKEKCKQEWCPNCYRAMTKTDLFTGSTWDCPNCADVASSYPDSKSKEAAADYYERQKK